MKSELQEERMENNKSINRIIQLSIGTIVVYFFIEIVRGCLPENLLNRNGVQIKTMGLIIMGIVCLNSIIIPTYLNRIKAKLTLPIVVVSTGLIIFGIELAFKIIQNIIILKEGLNMDYIQIMSSASMISMFGMFIANIRIHKLRDKGTLFPILMLIGVWIIIGVIMKN